MDEPAENNSGNVKTASHEAQKIRCGTLAERDKKYVRREIPAKMRNFTIRFAVNVLFYGRPLKQKSKATTDFQVPIHVMNGVDFHDEQSLHVQQRHS